MLQLVFTTAMLLAFTKQSVGHSLKPEGRTRTYYIAAVEQDWDYAPSGLNKAKGIKLADDRFAGKRES